MKKVLYALATGALFCCFSSCNIKDKLNINIDMSSTDVEFTIPLILQTGNVTINDQSVPVNIDSIIHANNAELAVENIKSVKLTSCTITMTDGDSANNFSALQSCSATLSSNSNTTPVQLAGITNNPDVEAYSLELPVNTTAELKDYFKGSSFTYSLSGNARKTTSKELHCNATIRYTLNVGL